MLLALFVVQKAFFADALFQKRALDINFILFAPAVQHRHFQGAQGGAGVAVCKVGDHIQLVVPNLDVLPPEAAPVGEGAAQKGGEIVWGEGVQHEDLAAGEQGGVDLEAGVFGGGADQHDAAPLHIGQERILLGLVEAVDLVYKQDGLLAEPQGFLGGLHDRFDLFDAAGYGAEIHKFGLGAAGDDAG